MSARTVRGEAQLIRRTTVDFKSVERLMVPVYPAGEPAEGPGWIRWDVPTGAERLAYARRGQA